jgi:hypothetical protein
VGTEDQIQQIIAVKTRQETVVEVSEWDRLVSNTYGRPYSFQQQDGCRDRGMFRFKVPEEAEDYENSTVPEEVNHDEKGVSFSAWLERDPAQHLSADDSGDQDWCIKMWWHRNFYPDIQMIANDLHAKGLLESGAYTIDIDW